MSKPSQSDIAKHAYQLWEREGRPQGRDKDHWHAAERDILGAATAQEDRPIGEIRSAQQASARQADPPPRSRQTGAASPAVTQAAAATGRRTPQAQSEQATGARQQQSGAKTTAPPPSHKPRGGSK